MIALRLAYLIMVAEKILSIDIIMQQKLKSLIIAFRWSITDAVSTIFFGLIHCQIRRM